MDGVGDMAHRLRVVGDLVALERPLGPRIPAWACLGARIHYSEVNLLLAKPSQMSCWKMCYNTFT